jgi:hypothetical protein
MFSTSVIEYPTKIMHTTSQIDFPASLLPRKPLENMFHQMRTVTQ